MNFRADFPQINRRAGTHNEPYIIWRFSEMSRRGIFPYRCIARRRFHYCPRCREKATFEKLSGEVGVLYRVFHGTVELQAATHRLCGDPIDPRHCTFSVCPACDSQHARRNVLGAQLLFWNFAAGWACSSQECWLRNQFARHARFSFSLSYHHMWPGPPAPCTM